MYPTELKNKVIKSLLWSGSLRYLGQLITWGVTLVVIRLLAPSDYGLMAMAGVIINFLTLISEFGLGVAIVQHKCLEKKDISIVFGFLILAHSTLALILFLMAPVAAAFYSEPKLTIIIQILSLNFILMCLYLIPQAILARNMDFRSKSFIELIAAMASSHFLVEKSEANERTLTSVRKLSREERIDEIARLIGGVGGHSDSAERHAKQMLDDASAYHREVSSSPMDKPEKDSEKEKEKDFYIR